MIGPLARARRALYDRGVLRARTLPRPVVSIGNLSVGGAGKTPHVQFLARWMSDRGIRAAILSRGYGRRSRGVVWVSDGRRMTAGPDDAGDEPALLAASLPGVPVLVGESRFEAGLECLRRCDTEVFLLDDGFQHLALRRDADILLVDADRGLGSGFTLPLGPLREPPGSARRADALVVTKCGDADRGARIAAAVPLPPGRPRAVSRLVPVALVDRRGDAFPLPPPGEDVAAFSGLARNGQFLDTLEAAGFTVRHFVPFRDHHRYTAADLRRVASLSGGLPVLTTEKDLVRLPAAAPVAVRALRIGVEFLSGWPELSGLIMERIGAGRRT